MQAGWPLIKKLRSVGVHEEAEQIRLMLRRILQSCLHTPSADRPRSCRRQN